MKLYIYEDRLLTAAQQRSALLECEVLVLQYPVVLRMVREALKEDTT